eukprot:Tamp_11792.p1 GENE.Tamp_11792~~Tamp_11792.p1  ORF type:complete len:393 (-),score=75.00 Tamp_11792:700-1716(-)
MGCMNAKMADAAAEGGDGKRFKRNLLVGLLGYLQVLPRGTGQKVLNAHPSPVGQGAQDGGQGSADAQVSASALAENLRKSITALYGEFVTVDGTGVDYSALRASEAFGEYVALSAQLARVDTLAMTRNERLAFFINIYNSLVIHAVASLGAPADLLSRLRLYAEAAYQIGPHVFSLNDIENGVLRGNLPPPTINPFPKAPFSPDDPRLPLACTQPDARIHFALNCAARGCPPIRFYKAETVQETLDTAAKAFCSAVQVEEGAKPRVVMSQIFEWYAADFSPPGAKGREEGLLEYVLPFLDPSRKAALEGILRQKREEGTEALKGVVSFQPYDWGLNSK